MDGDIESDPEGETAAAKAREPIFNIPTAVVLLIGVCVGLHLLRLYGLSPDEDFELIVRAAFIPIRYSGQFGIDVYAFTSPLTYSFLHGSMLHLGVNMIWLAAFGTPLANRLGAPRFLLFWAATAVAAVALHYGLHRLDPTPLIGASGAISGMMGAAARFGFRISRETGRPSFGGPLLPVGYVLRLRPVVAFLAVWMVVNLATGLFAIVPGAGPIAWEAHIGGFAAGFFGIGWFLAARRPPAPPPERPEPDAA